MWGHLVFVKQFIVVQQLLKATLQRQLKLAKKYIWGHFKANLHHVVAALAALGGTSVSPVVMIRSALVTNVGLFWRLLGILLLPKL